MKFLWPILLLTMVTLNGAVYSSQFNDSSMMSVINKEFEKFLRKTINSNEVKDKPPNNASKRMKEDVLEMVSRDRMFKGVQNAVSKIPVSQEVNEKIMSPFKKFLFGSEFSKVFRFVMNVHKEREPITPKFENLVDVMTSRNQTMLDLRKEFLLQVAPDLTYLTFDIGNTVYELTKDIFKTRDEL